MDVISLLGPLALCLGVIAAAAVLYFVGTLIQGDDSDRKARR